MKKLKNKAFGRDFEHSGNEIDLASLKGWEDREADNVKSQVDCFVFPVGHGVIVPAGRPSSKFGLRHWPSVFRDVVFPHGPGAGADRFVLESC